MDFNNLFRQAAKPIHTTGIMNMDYKQIELMADVFQELCDLHRAKDNFDDYSRDMVSESASDDDKRDSAKWAIEEQEKYAKIQANLSSLAHKLGVTDQICEGRR